MSGTELQVWVRLRGRKLDGWKFRRQQPIGEYYVDFYCPAAKLVVEINGPSHADERAAYDIRRQAWLEAEGYRVIRFPVRDVDEEVVNVIDSMLRVLAGMVQRTDDGLLIRAVPRFRLDPADRGALNDYLRRPGAGPPLP